MRPTLVVFDDMFRLDDHPALAAAAEQGGPVIATYIHDPEGAPSSPGAASRWWLHQSLARLQKALAGRGSRLIIRKGELVSEVERLIGESGATSLHLTRSYGPGDEARERDLGAMAEARDVRLRRFGGRLLFEPEAIRNGSGDPYRVFTPFWRACRAASPPGPPIEAPGALEAPEAWPESVEIDALDLLPTGHDWTGGLAGAWSPGEAGAREALADFLDTTIDAYGTARNRPDIEGTSRLSPHLHFGEISPRRIWHEVQKGIESGDLAGRGPEKFLAEIGWREFSAHLLFQFPELPKQPLRPEFRDFPWADAPEPRLAAWRAGRTGYPIVDAGMRELWEIGWMHNRVRMIVASFLIKDLRVDWRDGAAWFWDTLVDADIANNSASWQWVAGSGADAAPFFRVFNPVLQGEKFDPKGDYVRRWVPEIAGLPDKWIHKPWEAPADVLADAGVELGETYPAPMVDHKQAREAALAAYKEIKGE